MHLGHCQQRDCGFTMKPCAVVSRTWNEEDVEQKQGHVLLALPITPAISTPATEGPVIQVQTQTCGCTPPPNRKQKIMTNNSGKLTCTVTTLACWAP